MRLDKRVHIVIRFGPGNHDSIDIEATKAEIRWDENSFMIRGLLRENYIKVEEKNVSPE